MHRADRRPHSGTLPPLPGARRTVTSGQASTRGQPGAGPARLPSGTSPAESSSTCSAPGSSPKATPLGWRPVRAGHAATFTRGTKSLASLIRPNFQAAQVAYPFGDTVTTRTSPYPHRLPTQASSWSRTSVAPMRRFASTTCLTRRTARPSESPLSRQLPHTHRWAADHQDDLAIIPGPNTDLAKPRFQALTREVLHGPILAGPAAVQPTDIPRLS